MEKFVELCFETVIIALICVSMFSGHPIIDMAQAAANPASIALVSP